MSNGIDPKLIGSQNWSDADWADYWREKCQSYKVEMDAFRTLLDTKIPCEMSVADKKYEPGCTLSTVIRELQFQILKKRAW
jgi:hypothetical protein